MGVTRCDSVPAVIVTEKDSPSTCFIVPSAKWLDAAPRVSAIRKTTPDPQESQAQEATEKNTDEAQDVVRPPSP